nr:AlNc14C6G887 [Albugo laibachii Nc14]|eukprot:CCA14846.1 AlNc14C6G887 [Albugo laibachii Nc14]
MLVTDNHPVLSDIALEIAKIQEMIYENNWSNSIGSARDVFNEKLSEKNERTADESILVID